MKKNKKFLSLLLAMLMISGITTLTCFNITAVEDECEHAWICYSRSANCEQSGWNYYYCNICSAEKEVFSEFQDHNWIYYSRSTNCEQSGWNYYYCNICSAQKEVFSEFQDHNWLIDDFTTHSCTIGGNIGFYCSYCDESKEEYVEPTSHTVYWKSNNDATCTEDGTKSSYCIKCITYNRTEPLIETVTDEGTALGHDYSGDWTVLLPATCTDRGIQIKNCQRCLNAITSDVLPATDHIDADGDKICDNCFVNLDESSAPDQSEPDEPSAEPDNTPTEPEEPSKNDNVFSFLSDLLKELFDFFKILFKIY